MAEELLENGRRNGGHVGAHHGGIEHVDGVAQGRHEDLRLKAVVVVDADDLLDQVHPDRARIVQWADRRGDVSDVRLGGDQGLRRGVTRRGAHGDLVLGEQPGHAHALRVRRKRRRRRPCRAWRAPAPPCTCPWRPTASSSTQTGPSVRDESSRTTRRNSTPAAWTASCVSQTPSRRPQSRAFLASSGLALSRKNRIGGRIVCQSPLGGPSRHADEGGAEGASDGATSQPNGVRAPCPAESFGRRSRSERLRPVNARRPPAPTRGRESGGRRPQSRTNPDPGSAVGLHPGARQAELVQGKDGRDVLRGNREAAQVPFRHPPAAAVRRRRCTHPVGPAQLVAHAEQSRRPGRIEADRLAGLRVALDAIERQAEPDEPAAGRQVLAQRRRLGRPGQSARPAA